MTLGISAFLLQRLPTLLCSGQGVVAISDLMTDVPVLAARACKVSVWHQMISNAGMMRMHVCDCSWMGMHGHYKAGRGLCTSLRDCVHVFEDVRRVKKHSGSDREENYPLIFPRAISLSESLRTCQWPQRSNHTINGVAPQSQPMLIQGNRGY